MGEKNYTLELQKQDKLKEMIQDFHKHFPEFSNSFFNDYDRTIRDNNSLCLWITDNNHVHLKNYYLTQYECKPNKQNKLLDEKIKKWYLRFMNKTFDTYKQDYINNVMKTINEDFGI